MADNNLDQKLGISCWTFMARGREHCGACWLWLAWAALMAWCRAQHCRLNTEVRLLKPLATPVTGILGECQDRAPCLSFLFATLSMPMLM